MYDIIYDHAGLKLAEVELDQLFFRTAAESRHNVVSKDHLISRIRAMGLELVTEEEIRSYAKETSGDAKHWKKPGDGRRFIMKPITSLDYAGAYTDTGTRGHELGLWRHLDLERFPIVCPHPVALRYSVLATLVAKVL